MVNGGVWRRTTSLRKYEAAKKTIKKKHTRKKKKEDETFFSSSSSFPQQNGSKKKKDRVTHLVAYQRKGLAAVRAVCYILLQQLMKWQMTLNKEFLFFFFSLPFSVYSLCVYTIHIHTHGHGIHRRDLSPSSRPIYSPACAWYILKCYLLVIYLPSAFQNEDVFLRGYRNKKVSEK